MGVSNPTVETGQKEYTSPVLGQIRCAGALVFSGCSSPAVDVFCVCALLASRLGRPIRLRKVATRGGRSWDISCAHAPTLYPVWWSGQFEGTPAGIFSLKPTVVMSASVLSVISRFLEEYLSSTPQRLKLLDAYLLYILLTGALQFGYCLLVGTFPFNSFLSGFISCVGSFILAGNDSISDLNNNVLLWCMLVFPQYSILYQTTAF